jgi:hypothetical protein
MRKYQTAFTPTERRTFVRLMAAGLIVAALGVVVDQVSSPSLGWYGEADSTRAMQGVIEARPLG